MLHLQTTAAHINRIGFIYVLSFMSPKSAKDLVTFYFSYCIFSLNTVISLFILRHFYCKFGSVRAICWHVYGVFIVTIIYDKFYPQVNTDRQEMVDKFQSVS